MTGWFSTIGCIPTLLTLSAYSDMGTDNPFSVIAKDLWVTLLEYWNDGILGRAAQRLPELIERAMFEVPPSGGLTERIVCPEWR